MGSMQDEQVLFEDGNGKSSSTVVEVDVWLSDGLGQVELCLVGEPVSFAGVSGCIGTHPRLSFYHPIKGSNLPRLITCSLKGALSASVRRNI